MEATFAEEPIADRIPKPTRRDALKSPLPTKTIGEMGYELPIGRVQGDSFVKDFSLKPFRFKEEREIEKLRGKPGVGGVKFVAGLLGLLVETIHGTEVASMKVAERALYFSTMWYADMLYIYFKLRIEALGHVFPFEMTCASCNNKFDIDGDLNGIDVRYITRVDQLMTTCVLNRGVPVRGELRKVLTIRPVLWNTFENAEHDNIATMKAAMFQRSIVGLEGIPAAEFSVVPDPALDEMTRGDVEKLSQHIERNSPGVQLVVNSECPRCNVVQSWPIRWGYDSFFSNSSL